MAAPVRGTQSFVGVMAEVWKRPGLVGMEAAWRWLFGLAFAGFVLWRVGEANIEAFFEGVSSFFNVGLLHHSYIVGLNTKHYLFLWVWAGIAAIWALLAGLGRAAVLRRYEPGLARRTGTIIVLSVLRVWLFVAVTELWLRGFVEIYSSMAAQSEPNYVLSFAMLVSMTLVMFAVWCMVSWVLQLAPVMAMGRGLGVGDSIVAAWRSGELRGKLIEINLVMGIVKVALVVLAMVFSACPLPFSSVETQTFLNWWWFGVFVLWMVASDYFHVVRAAAYLRLWEVYEPSREAETAS